MSTAVPPATSGSPSFARLGVPRPLVAALDTQRITEPFEIQRLVLADALAGSDILGRAPTGSGKTLAFGLPLLARVGSSKPGRPGGLVLSPTRELAEQITVELRPLARTVDRRVLAVYGGTGLKRQLDGLRSGVDVLVACPGRLLDLIAQGAVDLGDVEVAVVDEADRMADMGFLPDVRRILDQTDADRQTMLFSATLDNDVQVLIDRYQRNPTEHVVAEPEPDLSTLRHRYIEVEKRDRVWLTADLITDHGPSIVFVRTRHGADRVARQLRQVGVKASRIHGGRSQGQRDQALRSFAGGDSQALVATDVAARGIHVDGVACVVHYDPPAEHKDYVHRSGRTGRAGAGGVVVSLLAPNQVGDSRSMQRVLGIDAEVEPVPDRIHRLEPIVEPKRRRRARSGRAGSSRAGSASRSSRSTPEGSRSGGSRSGGSRSRSVDGEGKRSSGGKATDGKSSKRRSAKNRSSNKTSTGTAPDGPGAGSTRSSRSNDTTSEGKRSGGHRSSSQPDRGRRSGGTKGSKVEKQRPKSKRSGKPRPKNRKNRPKKNARGRR